MKFSSALKSGVRRIGTDVEWMLKDAGFTGMGGSNGDHCRDLAQKATKINRIFPVLSLP